MTNRRPTSRPVSKLVVLGIVILFLSLVLPILPFASHVQSGAGGGIGTAPGGISGIGTASAKAAAAGTTAGGTGTLRHDLWQGISTLGWIVLIIGVLRTIYLRRQAAVVEKAKDAAGIRGERMTAEELEKLGPRYRTLNRFYLHHRGRVHEFDHVVIGPNGVFHVESKNWAGQIRISNSGVERSVQGEFHSPTIQMSRHHSLLEALLQDNGVSTDVVGILCFTNRNADVRGKNASYVVTRLHQLNGVIRDHATHKQLSPRDVARVTELIATNSRPHETDD